MFAPDLTTIDPAEMAPVPDVPVSYGPRNKEEEMVLGLVRQGLASGPATPLDDLFFAELDAIITQ